MRGIFKGITAAILLCLAIGGCESEDCMLTSSSYCGMSFVNGEGKGVQLADTISVNIHLEGYDSFFAYVCDTDTVVSTIPIDSLPAKGYRQETYTYRKTGTLVNRKTGAKSLELPLSYTADEDTFYIIYSQRLSDTLYVKHTNLPYFTSMDCGTVMHYKLTGVSATNHLIDSVQIVASEVTNSLKENVKIYFTVSD